MVEEASECATVLTDYWRSSLVLSTFTNSVFISGLLLG